MDGSQNCANVCKGGWWYRDCVFTSSLNGPYRQGRQSNVTGIFWFDFSGRFSLKYAEMKIRPKN